MAIYFTIDKTFKFIKFCSKSINLSNFVELCQKMLKNGEFY